jgi:hypothetical protein
MFFTLMPSSPFSGWPTNDPAGTLNLQDGPLYSSDRAPGDLNENIGSQGSADFAEEVAEVASAAQVR